MDVESVEHIEKIISEKYQMVADAIEEQTRLLRQVVELLQQHTIELQPPHQHLDENNGDDKDHARIQNSKIEERKSIEKRPPHRLQKMSKATAHDAAIVQAHEAARTTTRAEPRDSNSHLVSTLEERKKEFMKKTAPIAAATSKKNKSLLAIAAAKREMEREKRRRLKEEEVQDGSILTWIAYGLIGMAGLASLILGIVARIYHIEYTLSESEL